MAFRNTIKHVTCLGPFCQSKMLFGCKWRSIFFPKQCGTRCRITGHTLAKSSRRKYFRKYKKNLTYYNVNKYFLYIKSIKIKDNHRYYILLQYILRKGPIFILYLQFHFVSKTIQGEIASQLHHIVYYIHTALS